MTQNNADALFIETYPLHLNDGSALDEGAPPRPVMQIHITRSHMEHLLIGAANTAQNFHPKKYMWDNERFEHGHPEASGGSWMTRFDGGTRSGGGMPSIIVTMLIEGEVEDFDGNEHCDPSPVMNGAQVMAKVTIKNNKSDEVHYIRFYIDTCPLIIHHDGLELVHETIVYLFNNKYIITEEDVPQAQRDSLDWASDHIADSFGQGKIPRKRS